MPMMESFRISEAFQVRRRPHFLTHGDLDASMFTVVPRKGITKGMRCAYSETMTGMQFRSCPRNCKRRADDHKSHWGWLSLGRWSKATTREPGNLPPVVVTRERIGRGVPR